MRWKICAAAKAASCLSMVFLLTSCMSAKTSNIVPPAQTSMLEITGSTQEDTFTATGNEPGWRLDMSAQEITLLTNLGKTRVTGPRTAPQISTDTRRFVTTADGKHLTVTIVNRICNDSMSGMPRPQTVTVLYDGQELKGCGGNSADLLQGAEWVVTEMGGKPVAASMRGTLNFGKDGRVTGRSFCNNYGGNYTLTGEGLSIELKVSTLMACLPEVAAQEKMFTELLDGVQRFEIDSSGKLVLYSSNRRTLKARRA